MTESRSHPAVFAGLLGSVTWGVPKLAYASPLEEVGNAVMHSLVLQFLVGCAAGALVAGVVAGVGSLMERRREGSEVAFPEGASKRAPKAEATIEAEAEVEQPQANLIPLPEILDEDRWSESSLSLVRAQYQADLEESTGNLGRMRTGKLVIELEDREAQDAAEAAAKTEIPSELREAAAPATARRARHFANATPMAAPVAARRAGRHFKAAPKPEAMAGIADAVELLKATPVAPLSARHFSGAPAQTAAPVVQPVRQESEAPATPVAAAPTNPRARLANLPTIESRRRTSQAVAAIAAVPQVPVAPAPVQQPSLVASAPAPAAQAVKETADGRLTMTDKLTLRQRLAMRTKNVREVLAERLSPDAMDGIPHLERADGTVADIAPSWIDQTLVPALASITGITGRLSDTTPRTAETLEPVAPASVPTVLASPNQMVVPTPAPAVPVAAPRPVVQPQMERPVAAAASEPARPLVGADSRAAYISKRVAEVNVGMFPERRKAEDLEHEDVWEVALAAMGENIRQQTPVFQDVVGGPSTIDDPDGLEGPTGFIPFRVPAGRPDVVDTDSYINYLVDDELSQNDSPALQRSRHAYLRVIEGGTSPIRMRRKAGETGNVAHGRHFAQPRYAAEA